MFALKLLEYVDPSKPGAPYASSFASVTPTLRKSRCPREGGAATGFAATRLYSSAKRNSVAVSTIYTRPCYSAPFRSRSCLEYFKARHLSHIPSLLASVARPFSCDLSSFPRPAQLSGPAQRSCRNMRRTRALLRPCLTRPEIRQHAVQYGTGFGQNCR